MFYSRHTEPLGCRHRVGRDTNEIKTQFLVKWTTFFLWFYRCILPQIISFMANRMKHTSTNRKFYQYLPRICLLVLVFQFHGHQFHGIPNSSWPLSLLPESILQAFINSFHSLLHFSFLITIFLAYFGMVKFLGTLRTTPFPT